MGKHNKQFIPFRDYESKAPNGTERGYIRVTPSLYYSDAMRDLTHLQFRVFFDIRMNANLNSEVAYTQEMAKKNLGVCKQSFGTIISRLQEVGLIEKKRRGTYMPTVLKFSAKWKKYESPNRDAFTRDYVKPKKREKFQSNE